MKPKGAEFLEGKEFLEIVLVVRVARNCSYGEEVFPSRLNENMMP